MTLRPTPVPSFGMAAARGMKTTLRLKRTAGIPASTFNTLGGQVCT